MTPPDFTVGEVSPINWTSKQTFIWSIDRACFNEEKTEHCLWSPIIQVNNNNQITKWQIELLPKNIRPYSEYYTSIFINNWNNFSLTAKVNFCFMNNKNERVEHKDLELFTYEPGKCLGCPRFAKHSWITNDNNDIIMNGQLRIRCDISIKNSNEIVDDKHTIPSIFSGGFEHFFNKKESSDVTLKTKKGRSFHMHKCILSARSPVFEAMFRSGMEGSCQNEVYIQDFSYDAMNGLLIYIYTGRIKLNRGLAKDLLRAADKYKIKSLMDLCEKFLCDQITFSNVIEYLKLANMHNAILLRDMSIEYISSHVDEIVDMPGLEAFISLHPVLTFKIFGAIKSQYNCKNDV